jgi:hypothetical protein
MLAIPDVSRADVAFGGIDHMPKFADLPEAFQRGWISEPHCKAISSWFFSGASRDGTSLVIKGEKFNPKPGVDAEKALLAIRTIMGSWAPKHEHKIAACGYMLSEWFERDTPNSAAEEAAPRCITTGQHRNDGQGTCIDCDYVMAGAA